MLNQAVVAANKDHLVHLENQVMMALPEKMANLEKTEPKAKKAKSFRVPYLQKNLVSFAHPDHQDQLDHQVQKDHLDQRESQERKLKTVKKVRLAYLVHKAYPAHLDHLAHLVHKVNQVV